MPRAVDIVVGTDAEQPRVPQLAVDGPLDERDPHDDFGTDPVRPETGHAGGRGERRLWQCDRVKAPPQVEQEPGVETGADFSGKDEVAAFVITDQQRTETDPRTLRIGKPAD